MRYLAHLAQVGKNGVITPKFLCKDECGNLHKILTSRKRIIVAFWKRYLPEFNKWRQDAKVQNWALLSYSQIKHEETMGRTNKWHK